MTPRLGTPASRLLAGGLAVAVAAVVAFAVVAPIASVYASAIRDVRQLSRTLANHERVEREAGKLRLQLTDLRTESPLASIAMAPSSDGAAVAHLQSRMAQVIESSGALMNSVQALPTKPAETLRRIGLRLQFVADTKSLLAILHALEFGRPVAVLDNVFIHSWSAKAVGVDRPLSVRLDVFAFVPGEA